MSLLATLETLVACLNVLGTLLAILPKMRQSSCGTLGLSLTILCIILAGCGLFTAFEAALKLLMNPPLAAHRIVSGVVRRFRGLRWKFMAVLGTFDGALFARLLSMPDILGYSYRDHSFCGRNRAMSVIHGRS